MSAATVGPQTAMEALHSTLAKHDGTRATARGPFGPWVCACGKEVGDRFGWVGHVSAAVHDLWKPPVEATS